jgi:hypothetical protein
MKNSFPQVIIKKIIQIYFIFIVFTIISQQISKKTQIKHLIVILMYNNSESLEYK